MKICAISDTHRRHNDISVPEADVLVHCGDFTNQGTTDEFKSFLNWFSSLTHKHKIFICGNHELGMDVYPKNIKKKELIKKYVDNYLDFYYLENSSIIIDGVKFYGSPATPFFRNWAFNIDKSAIGLTWDLIESDTNVLITHGPPYQILDSVIMRFGEDRDPHQGCPSLFNRIQELKQLKAHLFGHLHLQGGNSVNHNGVVYVNSAMCDEAYQPVRQAQVISI